MKVFFYVQHLLGVGHLQRAAAIARALRAQGGEVVLASGGMAVPSIAVDVQLPAASAADLTFRTLLDERGAPVDDAWKRRRAGVLLDAWRASRAEVLVIELFPFGRRQMRFELLPLLEDTRRVARRPLVVCSVRDIIQPRPEREADTVDLVRRFFDRILVHGDPALAGLERTFGALEQIAERVRYTGYVAAHAAPPASDGGGEVVVSAGGGAAAGRLLETAIAARELTILRSATWRLLAGRNSSHPAFRALARRATPGIVVERNRDDFAQLLAGAALSISQAGYNTVVETLQARVRSVLVPFAAARELEQSLRAELLAERGAAVLVPESALSPETLADAVNRAARAPRPPADLVDLDGARRSAELLRGWVEARA